MGKYLHAFMHECTVNELRFRGCMIPEQVLQDTVTDIENYVMKNDRSEG